MKSIVEVIKEVEVAHFRTIHDTGANQQAMIVMNSFRRAVGLPFIHREDLPTWDEAKKGYYMPVESKLLCAPDFLVKGGKV